MPWVADDLGAEEELLEGVPNEKPFVAGFAAEEAVADALPKLKDVVGAGEPKEKDPLGCHSHECQFITRIWKLFMAG